jgi:hypothetical protein
MSRKRLSAGENEPDETFGDADMAFKRGEPDLQMDAVPGTYHSIGERVSVACKVPGEFGDLSWYRLTAGTFMHSNVIRRPPNTGQPAPPRCQP